MVYSNNVVVSVQMNGSFLKELSNGEVPIPLGSEYVIRVRNKHNRQGVAKITVDGENVSGGGFVVPANSYIDIERPFNVAKKFKFVSLESGEAIDFGKNGDNSDKQKGLIEVHFHLEKEYKPYWTNYVYPYPRSLYTPWSDQDDYRGAVSSNASSPQVTRGKTIGASNFAQNSASYTPAIEAPSSAPLEDGCTVEGSDSNQRFASTYVDIETDFITVKLYLQGYDGEQYPPVIKETVEVNKQKKTPSSNKLKNVLNEIEELELKIAEAKKKKLEKELEELKLMIK